MELKVFQMRTVSIYTNNLSATNKNKKPPRHHDEVEKCVIILVKHKIHYLSKNMNSKSLMKYNQYLFNAIIDYIIYYI